MKRLEYYIYNHTVLIKNNNKETHKTY